LFQLEKFTSLHIFFFAAKVRLGDRSPADCPAGPRCVGPQLSVGTLAPETVEKTMEWEDHTGASCWFFACPHCPLLFITFASMLVRSPNLISKIPDSSGKTTAASAAFEDGELLLVPCESFADVGDITILSGIRIQISVAPAVGG